MWTQLPLEKRAHPPPPNFWLVYCGQMAGWVKMPLGTEVNVGSGDMLDGGHSCPLKGAHRLCFRFVYIVAKWLDG